MQSALVLTPVERKNQTSPSAILVEKGEKNVY